MEDRSGGCCENLGNISRFGDFARRAFGGGGGAGAGGEGLDAAHRDYLPAVSNFRRLVEKIRNVSVKVDNEAEASAATETSIQACNVWMYVERTNEAREGGGQEDVCSQSGIIIARRTMNRDIPRARETLTSAYALSTLYTSPK